MSGDFPVLRAWLDTHDDQLRKMTGIRDTEAAAIWALRTVLNALSTEEASSMEPLSIDDDDNGFSVSHRLMP
jgi:hypothetical protein